MFQSSYAIMLYEDVDFKHFLTAMLYTSSVGTDLQPANQSVKSAITIQDNLMNFHR